MNTEQLKQLEKDLWSKEHQAEYKVVQNGKFLDLSKMNIDKLKEEFKDVKYKNIAIA